MFIKNDNPVEAIINLLVRQIKVPVTRESIKDELQKHPDPTSLLAISDLLNHFLVSNAAYNLSISEILQAEVPLPFIACCKEGEFLLVTHIDTEKVTVSNGSRKNFNLTINEFRKSYRRTILALAKDEFSGEGDYISKRRKEIVNSFRTPFVLVSLAIVFALFLLFNDNNLLQLKINITLLLLFKTIGLVVTILLLIQSLNANNPIVKKICSTSENLNCNAILTSEAAKVTNELSWSEVGFFYFAGTWLTLLLNPSNAGIIKMLAIMNVISLPYSFYSIYYQWRIAKQWCVFCCSVQALLWVEFFCFLPNLFSVMPLFGIADASKMFIDMFLPIVLWVFIKPLLSDSEKLKLLIPELYRFKYNKEFFSNAIQQEPRYQLLSDENSIILGNVEAENVVTVVSTPFCHACAKSHKILDELINTRNDVKLQIVFLTRKRYKEYDSKILTHFIKLKSTYDDLDIKQALNSWYTQKEKKYESWQENYPVFEFVSDTELVANQKAWCKVAGITGTPTLFINGRKLPDPYKPEDLKYIM